MTTDVSFSKVYAERTAKSRTLFDKATTVLPGGFTRSPFVHAPYPTFFARADGCKIWDVDGNEYIDYVNNLGPLLLGHNHPRVMAKVKECLEKGLTMGAMTEWEVEYAGKIVDKYAGIEQLLFTDSGSSAVGKAVRACRYKTGRKYIAFKDGGYHGAYDSCWPLEPEHYAGIPQELVQMVVRLPINNAEATEKIIKDHKNKLACVLNEPTVGSLGHEHDEEFLEYNKRLRELTQQYDVPFIMDEIVTGFRLAPGGYGERFGVHGDFTVLNKILGHGMGGSGAFGSSKENMRLWAPEIQPNSLLHKSAVLQNPGTMNDWKLPMAAGLGMIEELTPALYEHLDRLGERMRGGFRKIVEDIGIRTQIVGISSFFQVFFTAEKIRSPEQVRTNNLALTRIFELGCQNQGVNLPKNHCAFISSPMTEKEIDRTLDVMRNVLIEMMPTIRTIAPSLIKRE
jgi:glutamate-1-semialdehyde 2,1-aminomutase